MSQETLDATITIAQWLPIIGLRTVALIYAVDDVADTLRNHADIDHIEMLRNEVLPHSFGSTRLRQYELGSILNFAAASIECWQKALKKHRKCVC